MTDGAFNSKTAKGRTDHEQKHQVCQVEKSYKKSKELWEIWSQL